MIRGLRILAKGTAAAAGVGSVALAVHAESEPEGCARTIPDTLARTLYWQLKRLTPLGRATIPYNEEHVNLEFMTKVMRHASPRELAACCTDGSLRELVWQQVPVVTKVATSPMGSGAGFASTMCRAEVTLEGSTTPIKLVVKMAPDDFESSLLFRLIRSGETEAEFYRSSVTEQAKLNTPGHLFVDHDRTSDQFVLVQRDLSPQTTASQANGATVEQAKITLIELAKLNGSFFNNTNGLTWLAKPRTGAFDFVGPAWEDHKQVLHPFMQNRGYSVPAAAHEAVDAMFGHDFTDVLDWLKQPGTPREEGGKLNVVLAHVDSRLENMFLSQNACMLIDFQAMQARQPCTDVAYFLGQSMTTEMRRAHEVELLRFWYDQMTQVNGVDPKEFSWEDCVQDYHISSVYSAIIPYFWVKEAESQMKHMEPAAKERSLSTLDQVVRRSCAFVTDCNGLECEKVFVEWIKEAKQQGEAPSMDTLVHRSRPYLQQKFFQ